MTRADLRSLLCAARDLCILVAFIAIWLTAPIWGEWLSGLGESDRWERAAAERHLELYRRMTE